MEENIDDFPAICQYFPYQNFHLLTADEFVEIQRQLKLNNISEAPFLNNHKYPNCSHKTSYIA